jgi:transposase
MTNKKLPSKREITPASSEATPRKRATYTDEFKRTTVARLHSREQSATDLAIELGIRRNMLYKWADKIEKQAPDKKLRAPGRPATDELSELEKMRRELAQAREELAILKKFDAYLTRLKK